MEKTDKIIFEVSNLKKYYPIRKKIFTRENQYVKSVDGVSFSIKEKTILGLVGESGCGKSTIGKTILGLISPSGGRVTFGEDVIFDVENNIKISNSQMTKLRSQMQIIFQDPYSSLDTKEKCRANCIRGDKKA